MYGYCEQEAGVASGSGWNLWVWLLGVVVRRYIYRFPHTTYRYSSCICFFLQQHPYFLFIVIVLIYIYIYIYIARYYSKQKPKMFQILNESMTNHDLYIK